MAASTKDVVLGWGLTVARFTTGFLHLFAYLWDQSMSSAFLSMALSDIITAMLAAKLLPCYTKAFPRRCSSQRLKAANLLFATISISLSVLHILGIVYIHRIYSVFSYTVGLGEFPRLQNTGCAPRLRAPARRLDPSLPRNDFLRHETKLGAGGTASWRTRSWPTACCTSTPPLPATWAWSASSPPAASCWAPLTSSRSSATGRWPPPSCSSRRRRLRVRPGSVPSCRRRSIRRGSNDWSRGRALESPRGASARLPAARRVGQSCSAFPHGMAGPHGGSDVRVNKGLQGRIQ